MTCFQLSFDLVKRFIGILLLLVGAALIAIGVSVLTDLTNEQDSFEGRFRESLDYDYRSENDNRQALGISSIAGGALSFVFGLILATRKRARSAGTRVTQKARGNDSAVIEQLERLAKLKEQGALTEQEFEQQKARILDR